MESGQWVVTTTCESVLTWNYDVSHQGLRDLDDKAKQEQWTVAVDGDPSLALDAEAALLRDQENPHVALMQDSAIWRKVMPQERGRHQARQSGTRKSAFNRVVPALKAVGLLSDRVRPHYANLGLLTYEDAPIEPDVLKLRRIAQAGG